jgi:hypothetical protein
MGEKQLRGRRESGAVPSGRGGGREEDGSKRGGTEGNEERKEVGVGVWGGSQALLQWIAGMSSAWSGCEARFGLLIPAWLRGVFSMRWALLS